jgi:type VI protein secretion system component VasF
MIDHHEHVCHRMQAAQSTSSPGATSRGWNFSPAKPRSETPVWMVLFIAVAVPVTLYLAWVMT